MFGFFKRRRREALEREPFPEAWREIVARRVPLVAGLDAEQRERLEQLVKVFLAEKRFEGAGGLELTDEVRVTIAAHACLLVLERDEELYPELDSIVVYPSAYRVPEARRDGLLVLDGHDARLGESWQRGLVVLAWDAVLAGASDPRDGENVALHEFAHQLDALTGDMDGLPDLGPRGRWAAWARVLGAEYEALVERVDRGLRTSLDAYGATSPAEFFAVVTESFFERPEALERLHPELYTELSAYFGQDPAARARASRGEDDEDVDDEDVDDEDVDDEDVDDDEARDDAVVDDAADDDDPRRREDA